MFAQILYFRLTFLLWQPAPAVRQGAAVHREGPVGSQHPANTSLGPSAQTGASPLLSAQHHQKSTCA